MTFVVPETSERQEEKVFPASGFAPLIVGMRVAKVKQTCAIPLFLGPIHLP
jgi:hypothetical protein